MNRKILYGLLFTGIIILASVLRMYNLDERPMHADEAVQGMKFGMLLEEGEYRYDREEYHGPTLNYLTLPVAWVRGQKTLEEVDEITLRMVPAITGILTIVILLLLAADLGWPFILLSALLLAISPALTYYSRYYIHETLLAFFTLGMAAGLVRSIRTGKKIWFLVCGIFTGGVIATKETWIIHLSLLIISIGITWWIRRRQRMNPDTGRVFGTGVLSDPGKQSGPADLSGPIKSPGTGSLSNPWDLLYLILPALAVALILYSSFFTNMEGIKDAFLTFVNYTGRAGGDPDHVHSFGFYLGKLAFRANRDGMFWSEVWILIAALAGFLIIALRPDVLPAYLRHCRDIILAMAIYALLMTLVYSLIPYKTPWLLINFYQYLILVSVLPFLALYHSMRRKWIRRTATAVSILLLAGILRQNLMTTGRYSSDPGNPFVYAHTTEDVLLIDSILHSIAEVHPDGKELYIEIVFDAHEYWPLPWYLRDFTNTGWWGTPDLTVPAAPVVLADPGAEEMLIKKWYEIPPPGKRHLYVPLFDRTLEIRHGVEIRGYIRRDALSQSTL